ncbi:MAG: tail fiber domain-containing protein [Nocardiaceae bacterium]|nr:tail fiber domain-containing protein [Nocardiaceae bacterium]
MITQSPEFESSSAVSRIRRLRGVTWQWRDDAPSAAHEQPGAGVIAQDVQAVFPELVVREGEYLKVDYVGLYSPVMTAIAELEARVERVETVMEQPERSAARSIAGAATPTVSTQLDVERIAAVFPAAIITNADGTIAVSNEALIAPIIEAIKELDTRLRHLERAVGEGT